MRKLIIVIAGILVAGLGCARVRVEGPKEPIKVDISMRLDIYQHVAKELDDIESIVSGSKDKGSLLNFFVTDAYAQGSLSADIEKAALSRRDRRPELIALEQKGIVGENKSGLVQIMPGSGADAAANALVGQENNDRMAIYSSVAAKNGVSLDEVQKMNAKRLQSDAPSGTPVEALNMQSGAYEWKVK
ncbi:MAG: DUF1318 domain-containing protein [Candidatus Omnitrophota bacterium]